MNFSRSQCWNLLHNWAKDAGNFWYPIPGQSGLGCYGTGFDQWGVQTNQKYAAVMAMLATTTDDVPNLNREWALERALAALRFSLWSHQSGAGIGTDGQKWGHFWISALGVERMMFGVHVLSEHLTKADQEALRRMLTSEADWLLHHYEKAGHRGITGDVWDSSHRNVPESNGWNGALLWRTAMMYPDHADAAAWQERAHQFLMNTVSIAADATDETPIAGRPAREWHVGANFFPNYALDHHGYLNVGYMVICTSGAAMLHFDLKQQNLPRPDSLDWHQADLWQVIRRMIFSNGRLARIGGDSRVRYAYCQEYLLPSLLYAADNLGEEHAAELVEAQLQLIAEEAEYSGNGSFYGRRLRAMRDTNHYYYTRLEADRAVVLAMLLAYAPLVQTAAASQSTLEASVAGSWCEPEHGAVMHRSPTRLASWSWRAHGLAQGLCLPPQDGHLAEWQNNLAGRVLFTGDNGSIDGGQSRHRQLLRHHISEFEGGFLTYGAIREGINVRIPEPYVATDCAEHQIVFGALPDNHTVVGLQWCQALQRRSYVAEIKGLNLQVPSDLYNDFERTIHAQHGSQVLWTPPTQEEIIALDSTWANIDKHIGMIGLYGARELMIHRTPQRRGGKYESLHTLDFCFTVRTTTIAVDANQMILDCGWIVQSSVRPEQTQEIAAQSRPLQFENTQLRGVQVRGCDGHNYILLANFGTESTDFALPTQSDWVEITTQNAPQSTLIAAGAARLFRLTNSS